jgi:hypothetical protein
VVIDDLSSWKWWLHDFAEMGRITDTVSFGGSSDTTVIYAGSTTNLEVGVRN